MAEMTPYEKMQQEFAENQRVNVANNEQYNPDRSSRILNVAGHTGIPLDLIDADLDNLERDMKRDDFSVDKWQEESPAFAQFAAENPYNLSVLKHDEKSMSYIQRALRPIKLGWDMSWNQAEMNQIGNRRAGGVFEEGDEAELERLGKMVQPHEFGAESPVNKAIVWSAKLMGPMISTVYEAKEEAMLGAMSGAVLGGKLGGGATVPAGGIGLIPGVATGFTLGGSVGFTTGLWQGGKIQLTGESYNRYINEGFSHENAAMMAQIVGTGAGGLEAIGVGKFLKYIPGVGKVTNAASDLITERLVKEVVAKPTLTKAATRLGLRYGEVQGTEIMIEIMQDSMMTVGTNILANMEDKPDASVGWDEYVDSVAHTAVETFKGTMLLSAGGPVMSFARDAQRARQAKNMEIVYEYLQTGAKNSEMLKNVPDKYRDIVGRMTEEGNVDSLLIDVDRFDEYFQEKGIDPDKVAKDLGIANMAEARAAGVEVEIPMAEYLTRIAPTEHHNGLAIDLKAHVDQMSVREANLFEQNKPEQMKQIEALSAEVAGIDRVADEQIMNDIIGQLRGLDFEGGTAEASAQVLRGIPNMARRMGVDPMQFYEQVFGGIKGPQPDALSRRDVDVVIDPMIEKIKTNDLPSTRDMFGPSLIDFIVSRGGLAPDPELDARDFRPQMVSEGKLNALRTDGDTLDGMAEAAMESGFLQEGGPQSLLDAIDRELGGDVVHSAFNDGGDVGQQELSDQLNRLAEEIDSLGISLDQPASEIRKALQGVEKFDQIDTDEMTNLTDMMFSVISAENRVNTDGRSPDRVATTLAQAEAMMAQSKRSLAEKQDFGDVKLQTSFVVAETGKRGKINVSAQRAFEREQKRGGLLKKLLECVNG